MEDLHTTLVARERSWRTLKKVSFARKEAIVNRNLLAKPRYDSSPNRTNWETVILICILATLIAIFVLIEMHLRGLTVH